MKKAQLILRVGVSNNTAQSRSGVLKVEFGESDFSQTFSLGPHEKKSLIFEPRFVPQLTVNHPKLWWPRQMGDQPMHKMRFTTLINGTSVSDSQEVRFGIKQTDSELRPDGTRLFSVNHKPIMIRGGGWSNDILMRWDPERFKKEMDYFLDLKLNTIRLEGQIVPDAFFDFADEKGILVMAGFPCCSHWEQWDQWKKGDIDIARESLRSQLQGLQNHPSTLAWLYGSDHAPPFWVEGAYLRVIQEEFWPAPTLSAASSRDGRRDTGVKMSGPYQYVPPSYWYVDTGHGGGFGFNTETSVGPSIPPLESLRKFLPPEHLWPIDDVWLYHAGGGKFSDMNVFGTGLQRRYGAPANLEDYLMKAQVMAYDGHRAMFEAYLKNKYTQATGVIQWMLNNGWPSLIWHLYDYYLKPGGSYFGAKKANEDIHAQYSLDDRSVYVVNNLYKPYGQLVLRMNLYDFALKPVFRKKISIDVAADSSTQAYSIPFFMDISTTHFLKLELSKHNGEVVSSNFYWLSTKKEVMDWGSTDFSGTNTTEDGDLTMLNQLQPASVHARTRAARDEVLVDLENTGSHLAFFLMGQIVDSSGEEVLPALWTDNGISLLPHEKRHLKVHVGKLANERALTLKLSGWNLRPLEVPVH